MPKQVKPMGSFAGGHRSGWPFVVACLQERQSADGILLDEFVEATFAPPRKRALWKKLLGKLPPPGQIWNTPWVGIFHLPPNFPEWFKPESHPARVFAEPRFVASRPHLRGAVAFSDYAGAWLGRELEVPILVVKHPTELTAKTFRWDAFAANPDKQLLQIGWYLRNYRAIYQVRVPAWIRKVHVAQDKPFIVEARRRTDLYSPFRHRPEFGEVHVISWLENDAYDELLTRNVIFLELFDASANNAIIEAIARETPVVVNRHPAVAEYLGRDYPLFYDDLGEVEGLLEMSRIRDAHEHIRSLEKREYAIEVFGDRLDCFVSSLR